MGTAPTKLNAKTKFVVCPCGKTRLVYKSDPKKFCSRVCQDAHQRRGSNLGRKMPRPPGWEPSEAQREHARGMCKANRGKLLTEQHKSRLSLATKANWKKSEYRENALSARSAMTDEMRDFHRKRMVDLWNEGFFDDKRVYVREGSDGFHNGVWMRCLNSEGVLAREFDRASIEWEYEPRRFRLSWCSYRPDFYLPQFDIWIEVKGFWTEEAARKVDSFREETGKTLVVVMQRELPTMMYGGGSDF